MMAASSPSSNCAGAESNRVSDAAVAASTKREDAADDAAEAAPSGAPNSSAKDKNEKPLFNFKQVSLICERLVREREEALREEYDQVLTNKLAEQYDAFVKFTYDQIQRRLNDRPMSYVS